MKVFICWSGNESKKVAMKLQECLGNSFTNINFFLSERDIPIGVDWFKMLKDNLADTNFVIVCLTEVNYASNWINFEVGALAAKKDPNIRVCYYLITDNRDEVLERESPLTHCRYQSCFANEKDSKRLLEHLNDCLPEIQKLELFGSNRKIYDDFWADLKDTVLNEKQNARENKTRQHGDFALCIPMCESEVDEYEFNKELKYFTMERLVKEGKKMLDYCPQINRDDDRITIDNFRRKIEKLAAEERPASLLIIWPGICAAENQAREVIPFLKKLARNGCRIAFINEFPDIDSSDQDLAGKVFYISVDEKKAIRLLCEHIRKNSREKARILLINANQNFRVARKRKEAYQQELSDPKFKVTPLDIESWDAVDSKELVLKELKKGGSDCQESEYYDFIAAANDTIAIGAVRALDEYKYKCKKKLETKVVGYDGLETALNMIDDKTNSFDATMAADSRSYVFYVHDTLCGDQNFVKESEIIVPINPNDLKKSKFP